VTPFIGRKVKGQGHQADKRRDQKSVTREGLRTSNLVHRWSTMSRSCTCAVTAKVI